MKYLIFSSEQDAQDRSEQIAISQGCTGDVTKYWFGWCNHPSSGESALQITEDGESLITTEEVAELKDKDYMDTNGWFPPIDLPQN